MGAARAVGAFGGKASRNYMISFSHRRCHGQGYYSWHQFYLVDFLVVVVAPVFDAQDPMQQPQSCSRETECGHSWSDCGSGAQDVHKFGVGVVPILGATTAASSGVRG